MDKVTVDGVEVALTDGKFTLDMSSGADKVIVATDKALNSTTVTVKFAHTFGADAWVNEDPATCTEEGMLAHYECSVCHKLFDENKTEKTAEALTIAKLNHDYGTVTYVWATNNQSCTATRVCSRDATHVDTASSSSCGWWVSKNQSCTSVEETTYQARFANPAFATQTKIVQTKDAAAHTFGEWTNANTPDCTQAGNHKYHQCSVCNQYEYIDGDGATKTCQSTEFETKIKLAQANHTYGVWTIRKVVSCEEDGNHAYRQCSVCSSYQYITDPYVVDYDSHVSGVGSDVFTCSQAEFDTKIKLTATGHNYTISTWIPAEPNTCTTDGYYAYHQCDHCTGFQYIDDLSVTTVDLCNEFVANAANSAHVLFVEEDDFNSTVKLAATGHDFGDWVPAKTMECLTDGNRKYHQCSNCNQYEYIDDNGDTSICSSDEFDSHIKLESYGCHDTEVTYKGIIDGKRYHGNKCTREGCGAWDGDLFECSYDDWTTDETKHWHQCSVCEQRFDEDEHTGILVYNASKHWQECSVCEKELTIRTAHTFVSTTATSCSAEGCGYKRFDTKASIENIKLPAGYSVVELGHDTWRDGPEIPKYNIFYIFAVMPQIGGVSQLEKVSDLQIEIGNFAVGEKVSDVTFTANADAEVVYREVGRSGLVLPETTVIDNKGFYTIKLAVSAPVGYTFRGYTADDVTVKNELGEVISAEASDNGNLLFVVIETRSGIEDHDCSATRYYLAADKDGITNSDPEHKHRTLCAICGEYTYEDHVYDGNLDANCNLCGYKRYIKPDRLDIIVENYVIDGLVKEITIRIAENDYGISVVGTFNNDYHVYDAQGNNYYGNNSRFLPDEQYTIRFDVVANSIISFANVVEGNVYINGQLAEIKNAYAYTNTTKITYELKLPKLTGTTAQQKATGISFSASGVSLGGNLSNVVLRSTTENSAVIAVGIYFYRVNGSQKDQLATDVGKFTEGYQYYIQLRIKLAAWYYAKGMGEGDVTLGNFPLVGEVTYMDDILGAEISPGAGTIVTYTFKVLFEQGEEHVHKFTGENLNYDIDTKGHAVICDCGVLDERVAHVPSEENESVCSVCGGTIEEVLEKVEFTCSNYQVGTFVQLPALSSTSPLVAIDTAVFSDEYDFEVFDFNSNSLIIMPDIRYALVVMCRTTSDVSGLTKEDYVLKGVGETDITASFLLLKSLSSGYSMFIGFVLPELGGASAHIHGGTWIDEVPANCTAIGTKGHYVCTICGDNFDADNKKLEDLTINALGHTWSTDEIIAEVPANCTVSGTKARWHCNTCNKDFESDKTTEITELTIAAKGHSFSEWIEEVAATEKTEGVKAHKDCSVCGKHFDENGNELESLVIEKLPESGCGSGCGAKNGNAVAGSGGLALILFFLKKRRFI